MIYKNILDLIGNTPIISFEDIFIKLEQFNPAGSIKDRVALKMIEELEKRNKLNKNSTVIEVTSGNTGIAIAMVCAIKRYKCIIILLDNTEKEKLDILKAYGAKVLLIKKDKGLKACIKKARALEKKKGFVFLNQFENENNPKAHLTTSTEIINEFDRLDYLVCGVGSGGTISTLSRKLKEHFPTLKVIGILPKESNHFIPGIGAGFTPITLDTKYIDKFEYIETKEVLKTFLEVSKKGLLLGPSSIASLIVGRKIKKINKNANVLVISADNGIKYINNIVSMCDEHCLDI